MNERIGDVGETRPEREEREDKSAREVEGLAGELKQTREELAEGLETERKERAKGLEANRKERAAGLEDDREALAERVEKVEEDTENGGGIKLDPEQQKVVNRSQSRKWLLPIAVAVAFGIGGGAVVTAVTKNADRSTNAEQVARSAKRTAEQNRHLLRVGCKARNNLRANLRASKTEDIKTQRQNAALFNPGQFGLTRAEYDKFVHDAIVKLKRDRNVELKDEVCP